LEATREATIDVAAPSIVTRRNRLDLAMESHRIVREDRLAGQGKNRDTEAAFMTSQPIRDPLADHLITPANSALAVIDYQPSQIGSVRSTDHDLLLKNVISTVKVAKLFGVPIVHSTINVANGQGPTLPGLAEELADSPPIDRTQINSWEDVEFLAAVRASGRRKLILCALWTEVCMAFPALDAIREGYEVYPVVDAIGGTSSEAHRAGIERTVQAGAKPISWVSLACELQRDWARVETVPQIVEIVINERLLRD
jgi:nicotinamidase-related amidase